MVVEGLGRMKVPLGWKFDIPSLYDASCILGFVFTSLYMRRGPGFILHWGGIMTEYISFLKNLKIILFRKKSISNRNPEGP